jgi:gamma-glutamyltranspeptidase/glutathione hydrolase
LESDELHRQWLMSLLLIPTLLILGALPCTGWAQIVPGASAPEFAQHRMVTAANRLAAEAGLAILRQGGHAADAAIAVQAVLTLVEPQSSGIGGGAVALYYDAASHNVTSWDGRETAPAAIRPDLFLDHYGQPMPHQQAAVGGRAVGVPGTLRMLEALHHAYGKLPWADLFAPAIHLAEAGFAVSPRLARQISEDRANLTHQGAARAYFFPSDAAPQAGQILVNRPLSDMFTAIAAGGADALYKGQIAADIAAVVRTDPNAGLLTTDDLAAYRAKQREPVCGSYRKQRLCSMGPPSAGGVAVLETLGLLEHFNLPDMPAAGADATYLLIEAERLALADRDRYMADTDFVPAPLRGLLAPNYLTSRAQLIDPERAASAVRAGNPDWAEPDLAPEPPQSEHGTSQIAIVDDAGNAVTMTTTVQDPFGSRLLVHGFLLNDELTDFSFLPQIDGRLIANRAEPGKRPRSAMSPTLVFDHAGALRVLLGSQGGGRIISFVLQALLGMLDWGMSPQAAVSAGHVVTSVDNVLLEADTPAAALAPTLTARGEHVVVSPISSGEQAIMLTKAGILGTADPRGEGVAIGD